MPRRVLFVEDTVRGLGGSYESLFVTASSLHRDRFEPVVLFFQPNHFADRLESLGIRVLVASSRHFWEKEGYIQSSQKVRSRLPKRGIAGGLRRAIVAGLRTVLGGLPTAWAVYRVLRRERIDILHTNNSLRRDGLSILAGAAAGVPIVAHERQMARFSALARFASRRVSAMICISEAVLAHAVASGARPRVARRVYNAVDLKAFESVSPVLPPGPLRAGIVGRIMARKGQRFFLEAVARVREKFPGAEFYVIGQATGEDRAHETELRDLARRLGLEPSVRWTGYVTEPLGLMASLDVVVHAAVEPEPFGRVILEALALGRPTVATAIGGPVEIIEDGVSGLLVPPGDASALAEKVAALFSSPELRSRLGAGARRRAQDFGVESYVGQVENVYEGVLARDSRLLRAAPA
ncbi:MAG: glycosyltransferase [Planctomycetes bacterium]|nr:glycosyltransferase [Planctomycetota bacterium]